MAERIRLAVCDQLQVQTGRDYVLTTSLGVASTEDARVHSAADLVALADRALYVAKRMGRNQVATSADVGDSDGEGANEIETEEVETLRRRLAQLSVQAKEVYIQSIGSLVQALEEKDPFTARHAVNVSFYSEQIARQMSCGEALVVSVRNAGLLHDIGKVGIPDRILMKPSGLSPSEKLVMQQVPLISTRIIDHLRILESEMQIIRHQREYFDGSGHPAGLRGEQIPVGSRILLAADAFDAMTTERSYRSMAPLDSVLEELERCAGSQFDPRVVDALKQLSQQHRRTWQHRIDETVRSLRLPAGPVVVRA
jgi:HD-GYP domain-containing protein (c-di-GMP phosphodiesterase class II)